MCHQLVFLYPVRDDNDAFGNYPIIDELTRKYRVVYHEVRDEVSARNQLKRITADGRYRAKTIVLAGHGTDKVLALGDMDGRIKRETEHLYIDIGDFKNKDELQLARYLQPDGEVVLFSCSNGAGGESNPGNLTNTIARTLPAGITVHSLSKASYITKIDAPGGRVRVVIVDDKGYLALGRKHQLITEEKRVMH